MDLYSFKTCLQEAGPAWGTILCKELKGDYWTNMPTCYIFF